MNGGMINFCLFGGWYRTDLDFELRCMSCAVCVVGSGEVIWVVGLVYMWSLGSKLWAK